jgi:hypothetical protein
MHQAEKGPSVLNDFEFDSDLNRFFRSKRGVGSEITEKDEAQKRQLTVAKHERELLLQFHPNIPRGALGQAEQNGAQVHFRFRLFPSGTPIDLKINFPKPAKNELRLYFNEATFSPKAGDFWFLFERANELWIGSLDGYELDAARNGRSMDPQNGFDQTSEEDYQNAANQNLPTLVASSTLKYHRDPKVAIAALARSGHVCEMMPRHQTFNSRVTGKPYLEAHHFVPMMEQRHLTKSLDVVENICILNPYAHRMLHHATYSEIEPFLKNLAAPREAFIKEVGLNVDKVLRIYGGP